MKIYGKDIRLVATIWNTKELASENNKRRRGYFAVKRTALSEEVSAVLLTSVSCVCQDKNSPHGASRGPRLWSAHPQMAVGITFTVGQLVDPSQPLFRSSSVIPSTTKENSSVASNRFKDSDSSATDHSSFKLIAAIE